MLKGAEDGWGGTQCGTTGAQTAAGWQWEWERRRLCHIQRMCLRKGRRGWEEHSFDDPNLVAAFSLKPRYIVIGRRGVFERRGGRLGPGASKRIRPMGFTHNVEDRGPIRQHAWAGVGERKVWDIYADGHGGHVHMSDSGNGMDDLH